MKHKKTGAISNFVLSKIEYGDKDISETNLPQILAETCHELLGEDWKQIIMQTDIENKGGD